MTSTNLCRNVACGLPAKHQCVSNALLGLHVMALVFMQTGISNQESSPATMLVPRHRTLCIDVRKQSICAWVITQWETCNVLVFGRVCSATPALLVTGPCKVSLVSHVLRVA